MPRLICGLIYQKLQEEMTFLWSEDLFLNTVYVKDVVEAIWFLFKNGNFGEIYNLSDQGKTNQKKINKIISEIFKIKTSCLGTFKSTFARLNFQNVVESVNEKHMQPWGRILLENNINNSPLIPYLEPELLYNNDLSINGNKICKLGFIYKNPEINTNLLIESLNYWVEIKVFPSFL